MKFQQLKAVQGEKKWSEITRVLFLIKCSVFTSSRFARRKWSTLATEPINITAIKMLWSLRPHSLKSRARHSHIRKYDSRLYLVKSGILMRASQDECRFAYVTQPAVLKTVLKAMAWGKNGNFQTFLKPYMCKMRKKER